MWPAVTSCPPPLPADSGAGSIIPGHRTRHRSLLTAARVPAAFPGSGTTVEVSRLHPPRSRLPAARRRPPPATARRQPPAARTRSTRAQLSAGRVFNDSEEGIWTNPYIYAVDERLLFAPAETGRYWIRRWVDSGRRPGGAPPVR